MNKVTKELNVFQLNMQKACFIQGKNKNKTLLFTVCCKKDPH